MQDLPGRLQSRGLVVRWDSQVRGWNGPAPDEYTCSSAIVSSSIWSSSGMDETKGLILVSVVIQALYSTEAAVFEELRAAVLVDDTPEVMDRVGGDW
ncbi:hypothetical protein Tco_0266708 [Tanacetum coccineum]